MMRAEEQELVDVVEYATKKAKKYFYYGEETGLAVRDRAVEKIMRNWRNRNHITHRKEVHTILKRCYADEIRSQACKKRDFHPGRHSELSEFHDGGSDQMSDSYVRLYLAQEAASFREAGQENHARVAEALADNVTCSMQEIADIVGTSKATVSRVCEKLYTRYQAVAL